MKNILVAGLLATLGTAAFADGQAEIASVLVNSVSAIGSPLGLHVAGNFEVTFTTPVSHGLACDATYYTTKRVNDPDRLLFGMLLDAKQRNVPIGLRISDQASLTAYPGRCSIVAIAMTK